MEENLGFFIFGMITFGIFYNLLTVFISWLELRDEKKREKELRDEEKREKKEMSEFFKELRSKIK